MCSMFSGRKTYQGHLCPLFRVYYSKDLLALNEPQLIRRLDWIHLSKNTDRFGFDP